MKYIILLFFFTSHYSYTWANCTTNGDACVNPKTFNVCPAQTFSEDFAIVCSNAVSSWTGPSGMFTNTTNDIFYAVTISQDPSATTPPNLIEVLVSNMSAGSVEVFFLGKVCNSTYTEMQLLAPTGYDCQDYHDFSIPDAGTYYFAVEGSGTLDIRFSGNMGTSTSTVFRPASSGSAGCPLGYWNFEDLSNCTGYTPFKGINPSFELCLNGSVLATNSLLTYDLAPVTNQLCIRTSFSNLTGGESINAFDFNFGPALTAKATTQDCSTTVPIVAYSYLPSQQGGDGNWQVSSLTNTTSNPAYIPATATVDKKISWLFDSNDGRGDASTCNYTCAVYEFCFEITATNNLPADTKIVGVIYPDGYKKNAIPPFAGGNVSITHTYGCTSGDYCYCSVAECFVRNYGNTIDGSTPRTIDFEDPAPLPVELIYFRVRADDNLSLLEWATASEVNNSHFGVEHSIDGYNYKTIARVDGHGNSSEMIRYENVHSKPSTGINYYRLKQIDYDGAYEYSNIVSITMDKENEIRFYPNPTSGKFEITGVEGANVVIMDRLGMKVKELIMSGSGIDISAQPSGLYFISIETLSGIITKRIVKR